MKLTQINQKIGPTLIILNLMMLFILPFIFNKNLAVADWITLTCSSFSGIVAFLDCLIISKKVAPMIKKVSQNKSIKHIILLSGLVINCFILSYELFLGITYNSIWHTTMGLYYLFVLLLRLTVLIFTRNQKLPQQSTLLISVILLSINLMLVGIVGLTLNHYYQIVYRDEMIYLISGYTLGMLIKSVVILFKKQNHFKDFFNFYAIINFMIAIVSVYNMQSLMLARYSQDGLMKSSFMSYTGIVICSIILIINLIFIFQNTDLSLRKFR